MGMGEGSAVALLLRNDIAFLESMVGASQIGAYSVPINWHLTGPEVAYVLEDSGASVLIAHSDLLEPISDQIPKGMPILCVPTPPEVCRAYGVRPERSSPPEGCTAWESWIEAWEPWSGRRRSPRGRMIYTSGTTGRPKGVRRNAPADRDRAMLARLSAERFGFRPNLRTAMIGPLYHSVQATYATTAIQNEGSVFLLPRFDPESVLRLIDAARLTHLHLVPTMMSRLLELPAFVRDRYDVSSLEFVVHGAAPCAPDIKRRLIDWWGPIIHEYYGTTEAGLVSRCSSEEWLERPGTVGRPWPGRRVRILDDAGRECSPGTAGEVYMNLGPLPDFTYQNAEDKRREIEREGLITNGDVGYLDADGYLFLCDRKRDMVISGGVNIYPAEVEAVLITHPDVRDCAVFGIPDDDLGEVVAAAVQPGAGRSPRPEEIRAFLAERLARFKVPRRLEIRASLPRDESGKIFKYRLRKPYWEGIGRRI